MSKVPSVGSFRLCAAMLICAAQLGTGIEPARADFLAGWEAYREGDHSGAAARWAESGAEGDSRSQFNLGVLYDRGLGVARDPATARDWWRRAAAQGHDGARHNLALLLIEEGGESQLEEAVALLEAAASQGFLRSSYTLGKLYESGLGVAANPRRAFELIAAAAERGFVKAQYGLGKLHRDGHGTSVDLAAAFTWFRRAAEQGYARAQTRLATRYRRGEGVAPDPVEGLKWAKIAVAQGHEPAIEEEALLSAVLSEEEIAEAARRAAAFRPKPQAATR